jgi:hypothetical protein
MNKIDSLKERIKDKIIETNGDLQSSDIKIFAEEAKRLGLGGREIAELIPEVDSAINWDYIKKQNEEKIYQEKILKEETQKNEEKARIASEYIDALVQYCLSKDIIEPTDIKTIFEKADEHEQDKSMLAVKINTLFEIHNIKPYPSPNIAASTLADALCSTTWYSEGKYKIITSTNEPEQGKPEEKQKKGYPNSRLIGSVVLLFIFLVVMLYNFVYVPYERDKNAKRYYTIANDAVFRSSQIAGVEYNKIMTLPYGTELITYKIDSDWLYGKVSDKEGYIYSKLAIGKKDFYLLNSIFGDEETRKSIVTVKCKKAIIQYFKDKGYVGYMSSEMQKEVCGKIKGQGEIWQVFSKGKDVTPNTIYYSRIMRYDSKYTDFATIIKNIYSGDRVLLIFSFDDDETPRLVYEGNAPKEGEIISIKKINNDEGSQINVSYSEY